MKKLMVLITAMTVLLIPASAFASGGGNGNGTGGGKEEALRVESASIEDGAVLASDEAITLVFSKNVVNSKVAESNMALFHVLDSNQNEVTIEVIMADDQVEPDKKNDVVIQFPQGLANGTYTLTAQKGITSKSGDVMDKDYTLTFQADSSQAGQAADQTTEQTADQTTAQATEQTADQTTAQATEQAADQTTAQATEQAMDETTSQAADQVPETAAAEPKGTSIMPVIIIVVILAAVGGFVILRKKK